MNLSEHGFWVLAGGRELFLPFAEFPWFRDAAVRDVLRVEMPHPSVLRWPTLDVDLAVESIEFPDRFPLRSRARSVVATRNPPRSVGRSKRGARRRSGP